MKMKIQINYKKVLVWVLVTLLTVLIISSALLVINFTIFYPDLTLLAEGKVIDFFHQITLPIKIAKLSIQQPDSKILMPVYGARISQISNTWLAPRNDERLHEGQDIFAVRGTPVFSATKGYIIAIRENTELGGNSISIIGAGGRRYYYAHLDRFADGLAVGQKVSTDTVIGFVGSTGNAKATPPHLHFGAYALRQAIDPLKFLVDRPRF